ncbi:MAG: EamA family transporter [Candidatus Gottesmanbacteria bacterium]|nr:EamA family transporter [Candidatus Gottesmanbacteria bacterium]
MSSRTKALIAIIIASVLWATSGVSAKLLVHVLNPFVAAFYRFLIASICILPFFLRAKKPKGYLKNLIPLGLLSTTNIVFFYIGMTTTTANAAALVYAGIPLATALLAKLLIKEEVSRKKFLGVLIGLVGVIFIVVLPVLDRSNQLVGDLRGNIFIFLGLLSWATYTIFSRKYLLSGTYTPFLMVGVSFFTNCAVTLTISLITRQQFFPPAALTLNFFLILVYTGVLLTFVTYGLFQWAIQHVSATTASLKNYLEPVLGVGFNSLLLGETMTGGFLVGSVLVIAGTAIATGNKLVEQGKKLLQKLFVKRRA